MSVHMLARFLVAHDFGKMVVLASVASGVDLNGRFRRGAVRMSTEERDEVGERGAKEKGNKGDQRSSRRCRAEIGDQAARLTSSSPSPSSVYPPQSSS